MLNQLKERQQECLTIAQAAAARQAEERTDALRRYWQAVKAMAAGESTDTTPDAIAQFEADLTLLGLGLFDVERDVDRLRFVTGRRRDAMPEVHELDVAAKTASEVYEAAQKAFEQAKLDLQRLLEAALSAGMAASEQRQRARDDLQRADEFEAELQLRGMPVAPKPMPHLLRVRTRQDITLGGVFREQGEVFVQRLADGEALPDCVEVVGDDVPIGRSEEPRFDEIAIKNAAENKQLAAKLRQATATQVSPV